jgi:hypothetical protein
LPPSFKKKTLNPKPFFSNSFIIICDICFVFHFS